MEPEIRIEDYLKIDIRVGTIIMANINSKAKKPAYEMKIDFGPEIGIKTTSAQISEEYKPDSLINKQVVAIVNFPPKNIAGVVSEVLVLAAVEKEGRTIILQPTKHVTEGSRIL